MSADDIEQAVARGGPVDGTVLGSGDAEAYEVRMADRTCWEYRATSDHEQLPDGSRARVYVVAGRV